MSTLIKYGDWMLVHQPNERERLLQLRPNLIVTLGKYGKFSGDLLVSQAYGSTFEIIGDGQLRQVAPSELRRIANEINKSHNMEEDIEDRELVSIMNTNETLQDTNTSQSMSYEDILKMRAQVERGALTGKEAVSALVENSETFSQKNAFAQVKYIRRKQRKFMRWIKIVQPTTCTLCEFFFQTCPEKIGSIRIDLLSQMLCLANVQSGGRYLAWDDTRGLLLGAVLARCGVRDDLLDKERAKSMDSILKRTEQAAILALYDTMNFQPHVLDNFNYPKELLDQVYSLSMSEMLEIENGKALPERLQFVLPEEVRTLEDAKQIEQQLRERFKEREDRRLFAHQLYSLSPSFDALLIISQRYSPLSLLKHLLSRILPSRPIVIYSSEKEVLLPAYLYARECEDLINVQLCEGFMRRFQAEPGRFHPEMTQSAHGGYLLSAIKVLN